MRTWFTILWACLCFWVATPAGAAEPSMSAAPDDQSFDDAAWSGPGWTEVRSLYGVVHAHESDQASAERVSKRVEKRLPELASSLAVPTGRTVDVVIASDDREFGALQPGQAPSWADGTAWPARSLVFLHSPSARNGSARPLEQVVDHELVHVLLGQAFGSRRVPSWLQEGVAQVLAEEWAPDAGERMLRAAAGNDLMHLSDLSTGFPHGAQQARLAYAESADFIGYLRANYGQDALGVVVQAMAAGEPVEVALRKATGQSIDELDRAWWTERASPMAWTAVVGDGRLWTGAGAFFLVFAGWRSLSRRRARRRAWEDRWAAWELVAEQARADRAAQLAADLGHPRGACGAAAGDVVSVLGCGLGSSVRVARSSTSASTTRTTASSRPPKGLC